MNKRLVLTGVILLNAVLVFASGIAVISSGEGKTTLRRANKSIRFTNGSILESNDELETGRKSSLGCVFADGQASLRLFSQTKLRIDSKAGQTGMDKELELTEGSIHVKHQADAGSLAVVWDKVRLSSEGSSFLIKTTGRRKARLVVLAGSLLVSNTHGAITTVEAGKTADLSSRGVMKSRLSKDSDLTPDERAAIEPSPQRDQRSITVPLADAQGRVRYLELVW